MKTNTLLVVVGVVITTAVVLLDRRSTHREIDVLRESVKQAEVARSRGPSSALPPSRPSFVLEAQKEVIAQPRPVELSSTPERAETAPARSGRAAKSERSLSRTETFAPIHDTMEAAFVGENTDTPWARDARIRAEQSLAPHLPEGSRITSIECRATMCRIESNHDHARAADAFANEALGDPARQSWVGAAATGAIAEDSRTGSVMMVTYLVREGTDMPSMGMDGS